MTLPLAKIISGGQTGVDRGALDAAMELGLWHGGFCPKGRKSESGPIPRKYKLKEHDSEEYAVRTRANVHDADATLIIHAGMATIGPGTKLTATLASKSGRPELRLDIRVGDAHERLKRFLRGAQIGTLNVAGPRESRAPGIEARVRDFLVKALDGAVHPFARSFA